MFVFQVALIKPVANSGLDNDDRCLISSSVILSYYFQSSYWSDDPEKDSKLAEWHSVLWNIRRQYGKQFSDQLVGYMARFMLDGKRHNLFAKCSNCRSYIWQQIKNADYYVDNDGSKLKTIREDVKTAFPGIVFEEVPPKECPPQKPN